MERLLNENNLRLDQILVHCHHRNNNNKSRTAASQDNDSHRGGPPTSSTSHSSDQQLPIDNNNDVVYSVRGFAKNRLRWTLYHVIAWLPFLGLLHLLAIWLPKIRLCKYKKICLKYCDYALVENNLDLVQIIRVEHNLFTFEGIRYEYSSESDQFLAVPMPHEGKTIQEICQSAHSLDITPEGYSSLYGPNDIRVEVKSYWRLFTEEIVNPFYLFQIFSVTLWSLDDYYYYAACVLTLSAISIGTSLYQTRKQSISLRDLVEESQPRFVTVQRRSQCQTTLELQNELALNLQPTNILLIEAGMTLPCDCLLVEGTCILNECMLTGESIPVHKIAVDPKDQRIFEETRCKRNILYAGTKVIQVGAHSEHVLAQVLSIGFATTKGQLINSILHPKPIGFKFYKDSMRFVVLLFCCALFGMFYSVRLYLKRNEEMRTMIFGTLDVMTIIVPPSLPMAMTAGTIYSQNRLKSKGIFCISPPQINVCGKMKLCCFDKTGTLTEDGLTYLGFLNVGVHGAINEQTKSRVPINLFDRLLQCMATCHSLFLHENELVGDPLDVEMFQNTDWQLWQKGPYLPAPRSVIPFSEIGKSLEHDLPYVIGIYKEFEFTSEHQSMSVVVQVLGHDNFIMFAKGAPEKIRQMLSPKSEPSNFDAVLNRYAMLGYRVLALACKEFPPKVTLQKLGQRSRGELERNLTFLGFVVFENRLKVETQPTIRELKHAGGLRIVMATGDNILTAVSVARKAGIVEETESIYKLEFSGSKDKLLAREVGRSGRGDAVGPSRDYGAIVQVDCNPFPHHFAIEGATWEKVRRTRPELISRILTRGTIFARFRPEQKSEVVVGLQDMDYIVTMCGDGANDCTALKAANIGVSLSQAEASVAAPFTSKQQNIACVKDLVLEGRCALVTSFAIFKYMILYSVIQFCTVLILYTYCTTLGNFQFLYIDLIITAGIAFSMGLQEPSRELVVNRPSSSLISPINVIPLLVQICTCVTIQVGAMWLLTEQPWYGVDDLEGRCSAHNQTMGMKWRGGGELESEKVIVCWENTVVFLTSCFQYLVLGLMYSKGRPFRKPFHTNIAFMTIFLFLTTFTLILLLQPPEPLADFFELESLTESTREQNVFRYYLLLFPLLHIFTAMVIEFGMAERTWLKRVVHVLTRKTMPRNKFKTMDKEFRVHPEWIEFYNQTNSSRGE